MVILIVESVPPSLRGELSKWMLEPKAGVFVGTISAAVRELLWQKACENVRDGGCTMIYNAANEQGFAIRSAGDTSRLVEDWEGLFLVRRPPLAELSPTMNLWGKTEPFQPLPCHMVDAGHVALEILETAAYGTITDRFAEASGCALPIAKNWLGYLVALHDWGKGWRSFQATGPLHVLEPLMKTGLNLTREDVEKDIRHEAISRLWVEEHLGTWGGWHRRSLRTVGSVIQAHHGRMHQSLPTLLPFPGCEKWEALCTEIEQMVREAFQPRPWAADFNDHSTVGVLLSGLIVFADWVASNEELFPLRWRGEGWGEYVARSRKAAKEAVLQLGLTEENPWQEPRAFTEIWPTFTNPRPIQNTCEELAWSGAAPGLVIIEAPMGEGKSEAALYLASQWLSHGGGMYVALPTAATSNQMFDRVKEFIAVHHHEAEAGVQLVHGASWLLDKGTPEKPPEISNDIDDPSSHLAVDWFRPRKRSLLATYGVGTIDQALMSVLHVKHWFLRLFGLAGKVLIIDEVHAYDAYMNEILILLLSWCHAIGTPVILLSATLPRDRRADLVAAYLGLPAPESTELIESAAYPLITYVSPEGDIEETAIPQGDRFYEIEVAKHWGTLGCPLRTVDLLEERLGEEGCICVIANTVDSAQAIYEELKRRRPEIPKLLFHARFTAEDRHRIEKQALAWFDKRSLLSIGDPNKTERPRQAVLIATQVVEQSLDLDFDEMFSEIAPIDLLLQRSGRLHRHHRPGRARKPLLHILLPEEGSVDFGSSGRIYAPYILIRTCLTLGERWLLPNDIRPLIDAVYGHEPATNLPEAMQRELDNTYEKWIVQRDKEANEATKYLIPEPYKKAFKLDRMANEFFEDDEGVQTFFSAKTRLGNRTMRVLLVEGSKWQGELDDSRMSPRSVLEAMLLRTVSLPRWWFQGVEAEDGYQPLVEARRWLPVEKIIRMREGCWLGRDGSGDLIRIEADSEFGVRRTAAKG